MNVVVKKAKMQSSDVEDEKSELRRGWEGLGSWVGRGEKLRDMR